MAKYEDLGSKVQGRPSPTKTGMKIPENHLSKGAKRGGPRPVNPGRSLARFRPRQDQCPSATLCPKQPVLHVVEAQAPVPPPRPSGLQQV